MRTLDSDLNSCSDKLVPLITWQSLTVKLVASTVLGKMQMIKEEDNLIVPFVFNQAIIECVCKIQEAKENEQVLLTPEFHQLATSYLLLWNVLLWLQRDSIQFATYVKSAKQITILNINILVVGLKKKFIMRRKFITH